MGKTLAAWLLFYVCWCWFFFKSILASAADAEPAYVWMYFYLLRRCGYIIIFFDRLLYVHVSLWLSIKAYNNINNSISTRSCCAHSNMQPILSFIQHPERDGMRLKPDHHQHHDPYGEASSSYIAIPLHYFSFCFTTLCLFTWMLFAYQIPERSAMAEYMRTALPSLRSSMHSFCY